MDAPRVIILTLSLEGFAIAAFYGTIWGMVISAICGSLPILFPKQHPVRCGTPYVQKRALERKDAREEAKTPVFVSALLQSVATARAFSESLLNEVFVGASSIVLHPPTGFVECGGPNRPLSRLFAALAEPGQTLITGYLSEEEIQRVKEGAEPSFEVVASAFTLTRFGNKTFSDSDFAEVKIEYRASAEKEIEVDCAVARTRAAKSPKHFVPEVRLIGVFLDDSTAVAYLSCPPACSHPLVSDGEFQRVHATAMLLVKGKIIVLDMNKILTGESDLDWVRKAMMGWLCCIRSDNPNDQSDKSLTRN